METNSNTTPSEMLTLLLDGELDGVREQALYANLANDAELQTELRDMLAIRESVKQDHEAFTPPAEAKTAVFKSLGYAEPSCKPEAAAPALLLFFQKYWKPAAVVLIASLGLIYYFNLRNAETITDTAAGYPTVSSEDDSKIDNIFNSSNQLSENFNRNRTNGNYNPVSIPNDNFNNNIISGSNPEQQPETIVPIAAPEQPPLVGSVYLSNVFANNFPPNAAVYRSGARSQVNYGMARSANFPLYISEIETLPNKTKYYTTIQFSGAYPLGKAEQDILHRAGKTTDWKASLHFLQFGNFTLGGEIGTETFDNVLAFNAATNSYSGKEAQGYYFGGSAKYDIKQLEIVGLFYPYVQLMIGNMVGDNNGYLGKTGIGLSSRDDLLFGKIGFTVGYDGSLLYYTRENLDFKSVNKSGVTVGTKIKF